MLNLRFSVGDYEKKHYLCAMLSRARGDSNRRVGFNGEKNKFIINIWLTKQKF